MLKSRPLLVNGKTIRERIPLVVGGLLTEEKRIAMSKIIHAAWDLGTLILENGVEGSREVSNAISLLEQSLSWAERGLKGPGGDSVMRKSKKTTGKYPNNDSGREFADKPEYAGQEVEARKMQRRVRRERNQTYRKGK